MIGHPRKPCHKSCTIPESISCVNVYLVYSTNVIQCLFVMYKIVIFCVYLGILVAMCFVTRWPRSGSLPPAWNFVD